MGMSARHQSGSQAGDGRLISAIIRFNAVAGVKAIEGFNRVLGSLCGLKYFTATPCQHALLPKAS